MSYADKLRGSQQIMQFLGTLASRYDAESYRKLSKAMDQMVSRYGIEFVSAAVRKDPTAAELALFRYGKKHEPETEEIQPEPTARWKQVYPSQKNIMRKLLAFMAVIAVITLMASALVKSIDAGSRSDALITHVDHILEVLER